MTNREWLMEQMQNMSDEELAEKINGSVWGICKKCREMNGDAFVECNDCKTVWLEAEHKEKPKLSEAERVILENMDRTHKWIARDSSGWLYLYENKPDKNTAYMSWIPKYGSTRNFGLFNHLFQFIQWSDNEPYEIAELMKGE